MTARQGNTYRLASPTRALPTASLLHQPSPETPQTTSCRPLTARPAFSIQDLTLHTQCPISTARRASSRRMRSSSTLQPMPPLMTAAIIDLRLLRVTSTTRLESSRAGHRSLSRSISALKNVPDVKTRSPSILKLTKELPQDFVLRQLSRLKRFCPFALCSSYLDHTHSCRYRS